jgi:hypothetical protein
LQTRQGKRLSSLRAVHAFIEQHIDQLPQVARSDKRRQLEEVIANLSACAATQVESDLAARGATKKQRALLRDLERDHMAPIARIARAEVAVTAELMPLKLTRGKPGARRLATAAHGMAAAAAPFADRFISYGLPRDFVAQLDAAAVALLDATRARTLHRGRRAAATEGLKEGLRKGRKIVHILDSFVQTATRHDDPALLSEWRIVKR